MRSQSYFTFFFVAQKWPAVMQPAFAFLDWFLERLSLTQRAKILAKPKWGRTQKAERLTAESWARQQHLIAEGKTEDLLVFAENRGPRAYDMFAYLSIARSRATPPYLQWLDPDTPELVQDETRRRIFSVSAGGELFESRIESGARSEVLRHVERTFLGLDCLYGYGHATEHVISSPYLFIRGNDPQSGLRIDDFDYTAHIEDIYQVNLISPAQAEGIGGIQELGRSGGGVEVKRLVDERGALRGVGIYLWPYQRELAESVRRRAVNVMPAAQRVPPTYFLLVNREQLAGLGNPEMVRKNWLAEDVRILPYDFAQVRQKDIATPADSVKRTAALQELYGRIYPEVGREGRYIHEHLVDFPGLFESHATFQRVAGVGGGFEDYVKVYLGSERPLDRLRFHFLVNRQRGGTEGEPLVSVMRDWLEVVGQNEQAYGRVRIVAHLMTTSVPRGSHGVLVADVREMKQEAINLLVMMLDGLNSDRCVVPFLVLGEMEQVPKNRLPDKTAGSP